MSPWEEAVAFEEKFEKKSCCVHDRSIGCHVRMHQTVKFPSSSLTVYYEWENLDRVFLIRCKGKWRINRVSNNRHALLEKKKINSWMRSSAFPFCPKLFNINMFRVHISWLRHLKLHLYYHHHLIFYPSHNFSIIYLLTVTREEFPGWR